MDKKRILICGASGFVGTAIARSLSKDHQVFGTYRNELTRIPGVTYFCFSELADKDRVKDVAARCEPEVVIYCAGKNDLDYYEKDQTAAQVVFSGGPGGALSGTELYKPKFILISSEHVFSGIEGNFGENDSTLAYSNMGKAKVGGENYVRSRSLNHVIIRAAPLLGRGTLDHPSWIDQYREALFLGKELKVQSKAYYNPVHISSLIEAIDRVISYDLKNITLHVGGLTKVTPLEVANILAGLLEYNPSHIKPSDEGAKSTIDFSLNFSQSLDLLKTEPLLLEQSLDLLK